MRYIKEETSPEPNRISATLATVGEACDGVFGGQGGLYMIDEHLRGAAGNMPACQSTDVHVAIYRHLVAGDEPSARRVFNRLLPLINYERLYGVAVYKEVLVRRGVIRSRACRAPGNVLDEPARREIEAILCDIEMPIATQHS